MGGKKFWNQSKLAVGWWINAREKVLPQKKSDSVRLTNFACTRIDWKFWSRMRCRTAMIMTMMMMMFPFISVLAEWTNKSDFFFIIILFFVLPWTPRTGSDHQKEIVSPAFPSVPFDDYSLWFVVCVCVSSKTGTDSHSNVAHFDWPGHYGLGKADKCTIQSALATLSDAMQPTRSIQRLWAIQANSFIPFSLYLRFLPARDPVIGKVGQRNRCKFCFCFLLNLSFLEKWSHSERKGFALISSDN